MNLDLYLPAIQSRDADAFAAWMAAVEPRVRGSLRSFAAVVDVEAVLQETLLRVWQVAPRFVPDGEPDGLARLAVRIGRNLAVSEVRRIRARPAEDLDALLLEEETHDDAPPDPLLRERIRVCHEALPDKPRQALDARLRGGGGASDADLAASLAMRLNTFLQNFGRARRLLAACLAKHGIHVDPELEA